jgi:hypothetical protein
MPLGVALTTISLTIVAVVLILAASVATQAGDLSFIVQ